MRMLLLVVSCVLLVSACKSPQPKETPEPRPRKYEEWQKRLPTPGIDNEGRAAILNIQDRIFTIAAGSLHGVQLGEWVYGVFDWRCGSYERWDAKYALIIINVEPQHSIGIVTFITTWPRFAKFEDTHYIAFDRPGSLLAKMLR
jgi:hypothetical protein